MFPVTEGPLTECLLYINSLNFSFHISDSGKPFNLKNWFEKPATEKKKTLNGAQQEPEEASPNCVTENGITMCILPEGRRVEPAQPLKVKSRWRPPGKDIFKPFLEAVEKYEMIKNGDRVLVCLSGGKDSLTLLHTMRQYQVSVYGTFINDVTQI